jgi:hypothetical protein
MYLSNNLEFCLLNEITNIYQGFDAHFYKQIHNLNMSIQSCVQHYLQHGIKENRIYKFDNLPNDFNYINYIKINHDLIGYSQLQATSHYLQHGIKEKRKYL